VYSSTATTIVVSIFVENNWFTKEEYGSCGTNTTVVERVLKIQWRGEDCERESHSDLGDNEVGI
jgi:hypothetical protein